MMLKAEVFATYVFLILHRLSVLLFYKNRKKTLDGLVSSFFRSAERSLSNIHIMGALGMSHMMSTHRVWLSDAIR